MDISEAEAEDKIKEFPFLFWQDLIIAALHPSTQAICFNAKKYKKEDKSKIRGSNQYEEIRKKKGLFENETQGQSVQERL